MLSPSPTALERTWSMAAAAPTLTLVLAMERALRCPTALAAGSERDPSAARLLDALVQARVRLIVLSEQSRVAVDHYRSSIPGTFWSAESGRWLCDGTWTIRDARSSLATWIDAHLGNGPVMAVGDGVPLAWCATLAPCEVGIAGHDRDTTREPMQRRQLAGPSAVRAFLWSLIQQRTSQRAGSSTHAMPRRSPSA